MSYVGQIRRAMKFGDLGIGRIFEYTHGLYIKTNDSPMNAVCIDHRHNLTHGMAYNFGPNDDVEEVKCVIIRTHGLSDKEEEASDEVL